jgi:nitrogen fixation/metabolism regulation signal transduction histidine kinase
MTTSARQRKIWSVVLGSFGLLLFAWFATLNAWDPKGLRPSTTGQIFLYTALSAMAFVVFVGVLVMLARNVLKLYADQKSRVMGSRLRTRMMVGAVLVSLVPLFSMFSFSYLLMNRAVDRWFTQPVTEMRDDSNRMAVQLSQYTASNARVEAESIAGMLPGLMDAAGNRAAIERVLRDHEVTLQGGFAVVFRDGHAVAGFHLPQEGGTQATVKAWIPPAGAEEDGESGGGASAAATAMGESRLLAGVDDAILAAAQRSDEPIYSTGPGAVINRTGAKGNAEYSLGLATVVKKNGPAVNVVVGLPLPYGMTATMGELRAATDSYWRLVRGRREIRNFYMLLLLMITGLALFASTWLALHLSKQVTKPVEALADAMVLIAAGNYGHRVQESATEELGELVRSFNHMAQDLEGSRAQVEASTALLSAANGALEARRGELETMLQTIPNGVATLDRERRIVLANRALSEMLDPGGQRPFIGLTMEEIFPAEMLEGLDRLLRRSHRMGSAAGEMEMNGNGNGTLNLLATVALLETSGERTGVREHLGYVLVLENATELLRAQKQSAWKEVARRVAHEIKNPLTPISLSAEQIGRHIDRLDGTLSEAGVTSPSVAVIRRCSEVISTSVESMRGLVDQFAALAQFPTAQPRPADLNTIVENSLALFAGRMQNVRLIRKMEGDLPLVLADPEAMKRALGNLVDNAVEAMQGSLLREMRITTALLESGMVELTVSDTGTGLTDEMRERLFLPYFSTKQRGTGLGLAIAAKIIQEHEGTIRAEKNEPAGAKFIVELKAVSATEERIETISATVSA